MESLHVTRKDETLYIGYDGEITIEDTAELKRTIEGLLGEPYGSVVMDLSKVGFMDSSGIGFLVALNTRVQNAGKKFYLFRPSQQVKKTLELVQLIRFFEIAEDEEELTTLLPG